MTAGPGASQEPDGPDGSEVDYHPADLTADQMGYVRREAADRAAAGEPEGSAGSEEIAGSDGPGAGEQPVPGATADSAPPLDDGAAYDQEAPEAAPDDEVDPEAAAVQAQLAQLTDQNQRLRAEMANFRRRVERDREKDKQDAVLAVLTSLLPVMDDIDRAREHGEVEGGFKAVADSLDRAVAGLGLVKFGQQGEEFDPTQHEALMQGHSPDVTTTTVDKVVQAGYRIGERVVRAAKVTVLDPEG